jgi:hypothetical protein
MARDLQEPRLCAEIDGRVKAFLARPIEWPYVRIDATHVRVRKGDRICGGNISALSEVRRASRNDRKGSSALHKRPHVCCGDASPEGVAGLPG